MMGTLEQKRQLQQRSNILVGITVVCVIGFVAAASMFGDAGMAIGLPLMLIGGVCWIGGLMAYSQSKGYSSLMGLLALIGLVGLFILLILPDQWKIPVPPVQDPLSNYPRHPGHW